MKQNVDMTEMQEQHLDMMIKLAFDMEDAEEVQRILDEPDPELSAEDEAFTNAIFANVLDVSEQQSRKERRQRYAAKVRRIFPRLVEVAACLILAAAIATPVALASSATFRSKVMQLLLKMDNEKGEAYFSFVEDEAAEFWVPEGWQGSYYPSYIPKGYEVYDFDPFFTMIEYRNAEDDQLYFDEYDEDTDLLAGIEDSNVRAITINGHSGYIIDGVAIDGVKHAVTIIWQNDSKWFAITGFGISSYEAMTVATSVKQIIK